MKRLNIIYIEPQYKGSHKNALDGYVKRGAHRIMPLTYDGDEWEGTVVTGAADFAGRINTRRLYKKADLIFSTDLIDFEALCFLLKDQFRRLPKILMFLENQLAWPEDKSIYSNDSYLKGTNVRAALAADVCFFNSEYSLRSFLKELPLYAGRDQCRAIREKSSILPLGVDFEPFRRFRPAKAAGAPIVIFPHRFDPDKNPEEFLKALNVLAAEKIDFQVIITGVKEGKPIDRNIQALLRPINNRLIFIGYAEDREEMADLMCQADIFVSTSMQEYFGASTVEALYAGCYPILPNRLSYPEFIPERNRKDHLYDGFDDLVNKLRFALLNPQRLKTINFRSEAIKYDWIKVKKQWDSAFEEIKAGTFFR
jgi:glycosyltransferase involved in cell wall biosynthesis